MTEPSLEERQKFLDDMSKFIDDAENCMKDLCSSVGWDYNYFYNYEETEKYAICPFNDGHRVPERTMHKHLVKCEWKALGYTKECVPLPEPVLPPDDPSTIKLDMQLQAKVLQEAKKNNPDANISLDEKFVPQTSDRLTSDFTSDERKAMYEYVIANTVGPDIGHDITEMNKPEKTLEGEIKSTPIELLLAQERNLKRRRAKHRGVHTNKKSHTEIMREIVQQQMEMYREHLSEKYGIPIPNDEVNAKPSEKEQQNKKNHEDDLNENSEQSSHSKRDRKNWNSADRSDYKKRYNSKSLDEKSERVVHEGRDYSSSRRYSNYNNDYDSWSSAKKHQRYDSRDKYRDEHDSRDRSWDKYDSRGKHRDTYESRNKDKDRYESQDSGRDKNESRDANRLKYDSRDSSRNNKHGFRDKSKDKYDSRDKSRDDYDSQGTNKDKYHKYESNQSEYATYNRSRDRDESSGKKESKSIVHESRSRKREKSESIVREFVKASECEAKKSSSHKKHKKDRKREEDRSRDKEDAKKHKKSKHKKSRDRSQSLSSK
ncbi:U11/U12 small nuclear ribonucleoprotein 48 kDa protein [Nasonia vitripennis]|uniref:CHHC U11-48K-type domain-containing protein n=1 Tax=Nasonia vitripennis TaxID=7425 RepID=A0A7M7H962_NASVI|nr:U11/U12 small nuclear ribonucleoprotein 48 kDa protein [Nasonia vitripennis]